MKFRSSLCLAGSILIAGVSPVHADFFMDINFEGSIPFEPIIGQTFKGRCTKLNSGGDPYSKVAP